MSWLALACMLGCQQEAPALLVGQPVAGRIEKDSAAVHSPALDQDYQPPFRARSYILVPTASGVHTVRLRSHDFDAYLILRNSDGEVIAEDDDAWMRTHAEIRATLDKGLSYRVDAVALHGESGAFTLSVEVLTGPPADARQRALDGLADLQIALAKERAREQPNPIAVGNLLNEAGMTCYQLGDFAPAVRWFEQGLAAEIEASGEISASVVSWHNNLAYSLERTGDFESAWQHGIRALEIEQELSGADSPELVVPMIGVGNASMRLGRLEYAEKIFHRAVELADQKLGEDVSETGVAHSGLATVLEQRGRVIQARQERERALEIARRVDGPDSPAVATELLNLGLLLSEQGLHDDAVIQLERALAINRAALGPQHPNTVQVLANLAVLRNRLGDTNAALALFEQVIPARIAALGADHPAVATSLEGMAAALTQAGRVDEGLAAMERAADILQRSLGPDHPRHLQLRINRCELFSVAGRDAEALAAIEALLPDLGTGPFATESSAIQLRTQRAVLLYQADCLEEAFAAAIAADQLERSMTGWRSVAMSESERLRSLARGEARVRLIIQVLEDLVRKQQERGLERAEIQAFATQAYQALLAWKGAASRDLLTTREHLMKELEEAGRAELDRLRQVQQALSGALLGGDALTLPQIERLVELRGDLERRLMQRLGNWSAPKTPDLSALQQALPSGTALVDCFVVDRLYLWVIRGGHSSISLYSVNQLEELESLLDRFRRQLITERGGRPVGETGGWRETGAQIHQRLWQRMEPSLGGVGKVVLCPDSFLCAFPFDALPTGPDRLLIEDLELAYVDDVSALLDDPPPPSAAPSLVAVGGVDFSAAIPAKALGPAAGLPATSARGTAFGQRWPRLPATAAEVDAVTEWHREAFGSDAPMHLLVGAEATEAAVKQAMPEGEVVHLATHGFFRPEGVPSMWQRVRDAQGRSVRRMEEGAAALVERHPGLLSGLVLAGVNHPDPTAAEDGYLTAEEVAWLDLHRVRLVVLSACETGLGRRAAGEGLQGLRRAFRMAGAGAVISSLWEVDDRATRDLMTLFYEQLWLEGLAPVAAFRVARLRLLEQARLDDGDPQPAFWGAFVLSGAWR